MQQYIIIITNKKCLAMRLTDSVRLDDIWKSLKEECSISTKKRGPLKDINHLWETTKGGSSSTVTSTSTSTAANRKLVRNRSRKHIYTKS